jgi:hypothetical protein
MGAKKGKKKDSGDPLEFEGALTAACCSPSLGLGATEEQGDVPLSPSLR